MFQRKINQAIYNSNASHNDPINNNYRNITAKKEWESLFVKK